MENFIIIAIVACIVAAIVYYLYKCKKRGDTCIGCPYAKCCLPRKIQKSDTQNTKKFTKRKKAPRKQNSKGLSLYNLQNISKFTVQSLANILQKPKLDALGVVVAKVTNRGRTCVYHLAKFLLRDAFFLQNQL